jgi:D-alanine-D-alanine ligase
MRKKKVLVLMHADLVPPDDIAGKPDAEVLEYKTEYDVVTGLRDLGHEVQPLGLYDDLTPLRGAIQDFKPHIVFNLLEEFRGEPMLDQNVVSYLELVQVPYTGCNPRGLMIARDKALSKMILHHHRIRVPRFAVVPAGRKLRRKPARLEYPIIVKSQVDEASLGILDSEGRPYFLEANPNPDIGYGEEFAEAAEAAGIDYEPLLDRILAIGLRKR